MNVQSFCLAFSTTLEGSTKMANHAAQKNNPLPTLYNLKKNATASSFQRNVTLECELYQSVKSKRESEDRFLF